MHIKVLTAMITLLVCLPAASRAGLVYTLKPGVNLYKKLGPDRRVEMRLAMNQTLHQMSRRGPWVKVRTLTGRVGYVRAASISDLWLKVHKAERVLYLMKGRRAIKIFRMALSPQNPLGDKVKQGDGGTPEGRFFICEALRKPPAARYGARSLRLSYPNIEDARRGLRKKLVSYLTYLKIVRAIRAGRMPPQKTRLGGSIRIHGGGAKRDWTLGCIALDDKDVIEIFGRVGKGARVEVYRNAAADRRLNSPGYLNRLILAGARLQIQQKALYTSQALAEYRLSYPGGDIRPNWAVCTDVVIRALRTAGLDLQALIHEDAIINPGRYRRWIRRPNVNIDHRRTRNLQVFLSHHAKVLPLVATRQNRHLFRPGDIVTMDTGIRNGSVFDHIGIVARATDERGIPLVINIWTVGYRTSAMSLLGRTYPKIVGHFRLTHPFDYN
jgi:uncharacterized protein YijF (DUF1287 family)